MKILLTALFSLCVVSTSADEIRTIPAYPPLAELEKLTEEAAIILICNPNATRDKLEVLSVIKGEQHYKTIKDTISDYLGASDKKALATKGYREAVFISSRDDQQGYQLTSTLALWPQRDEVLAHGENIRFLSHTAADLERIIQEQQKKDNKSEQATPRKPSD